jgi:oligopeptide transport system substrate-binding protein
MRKSLFFSCTALVTLPILAYIFFYAGDKQSKSTANLKHLRVNLAEGEPPSIHPHRGSDVRARILGKSLFEGLTRVGEKGTSELAAAENVEIDPSRCLYTFTLRPHRWSNNEPVTAYHFENAWKRAVQPDSLCVRSDLFYIIKNAKKAKRSEVALDQVGVYAKDEKTLIVELNEPAPYFLDLISNPMFSPLYNEDAEPNCFNGPFVMGERKRGVKLQLVRSESYWDKAHVDIEKVSISMIPDAYSEFALFEKAEFDVMGNCFEDIPLDILPKAMSDTRFATQKISRIFWLYLNPLHPLFQSAKIRKAFSCALDRDHLVKNLLLGDIPCTTILPNNLTLLKESSDADANTAKAIKLFEEGLHELGLKRESLPPVTLSYGTYAFEKSLSQVLQEKWQNVFGIPISVEGLEWNILSDHMIHGKYDITTCTRHAMYEDPYYFLEIFKDKNSSYNFSRWENTKYKEILDRASKTTDLSEREKLLREAEVLLLEEMPVIPVHMQTCKYLTLNRLQKYRINNSGYVDFKAMQISDIPNKPEKLSR